MMGGQILIIALLLAVFAYLSLRNRQQSLLLLLLFIPSFLIRFSIGPIPTTLFEMGIYILAGATLLKDRNLITESVKTIQPFFFRAHVVLLIAAAIGIYISPEKRVALGFVKGFVIDPILLFMLIKIHAPQAYQRVAALTAYIVSAVTIAIMAIIRFDADRLTGEFRAHGVFESANYLSMYIEPALAALIAILLINWRLTERIRFPLLIAVPLFAVAIPFLLARSYAGWLAVFAATVAVLVVVKIPFRKTVIALMGLVVVGALATQWNSPKLQNIIDPDKQSSMSSRSEIYTIARQAIKERPWFGLGPGQFDGDAATGNINYWDGNADRILGHPPQDTEVLHAHNIFLSTYIYFGLAGLLALIAIIANFAGQLELRHTKQQVQSEYDLIKSRVQQLLDGKKPDAIKIQNPEEKGDVRHFIDPVALAMMTTIIVHGLLDTTIWKNDLAAIFWLTLALIFHSHKQQKNENN